MANARGKSIDNTHLSIDTAEERGFIHRDYIAHCLRWSHVVRYLTRQKRYAEARVLEIGCGKELPLLKTMYTSRMHLDEYCGVDVNKLVKHDWVEKVEAKGTKVVLHEKTVYPQGVSSLLDEYFNYAVCFEVLEHVEPEMAFEILQGIYQSLDLGGIAFISTPNYDPSVGAAGNHVNEMRYEVTGYLIEEAGLEVLETYGTFASQKDIKESLESLGLTTIFRQLGEYYDVNYLATIFAPLFPRLSRNCLWQVAKTNYLGDRKFPSLPDFEPGTLTSSEKEDQLHAIGD